MCAVTVTPPRSLDAIQALGNCSTTTPITSRHPAPASRTSACARLLSRRHRHVLRRQNPRLARRSPPPCARSAPTGSWSRVTAVQPSPQHLHRRLCRHSPSARSASTIPRPAAARAPARRSWAPAAPRASAARCRGRRTRARPKTRTPRRAAEPRGSMSDTARRPGAPARSP